MRIRKKYRKGRMIICSCLFLLLLSGCSDGQSSEFYRLQSQKLAEDAATQVPGKTCRPDGQNGANDRAGEDDASMRRKARDEYGKIMDAYSDTEISDKTVSEQALSWYYYYYGQIRSWAGPIVVVSVSFGTLLLIFSKGNKRRRQWGLYGLIIGVPLLMVFLVYGVGILNGMFIG